MPRTQLFTTLMTDLLQDTNRGLADALMYHDTCPSKFQILVCSSKNQNVCLCQDTCWTSAFIEVNDWALKSVVKSTSRKKNYPTCK